MFKKEERKKTERKFKKEINEWDGLFNGNPALSQNASGVLTLSDKITKIINDSLKKSMKRLTAAE